jgi:chaperonin cofactor prefoldin
MNSAKDQKERNYALLAKRIKTLSNQLAQTEAHFENMQGDLESMRIFAALHASQ